MEESPAGISHKLHCNLLFLSFISKWELEEGEFGVFFFFFWLSGMNQQINLIYKVNFTDACCLDQNKLPLFILQKEFGPIMTHSCSFVMQF